MTTVLFIGIIQALFLGLLVVYKKSKSQADYMLIAMLVYLALHQTFFLINFSDSLSLPLPIMIIGGGFPLLYGPILLWYVLSLIREKPVNKLEFLIHLVPYLLFVLSFSYFHYNVDGSEVSVYDGFLHIHGEYPMVMRLYSIYFAISGAVYPIASLVLLQLHKRNIHTQFSFEEEINLDWLRILLLSTIVAFLISFFTILFVVDWQWIENPRQAFYVVSVVNTIFIFFMGFFGLKQTTIFTPHLASTNNTKDASDDIHEQRYSKSGLDAERSQILFEKLDKKMIDEKLYLDGKLSLAVLAEMMNVSSNHLSQAINENLEVNFYDYVNNYRVVEVKRLFQDDKLQHLTLLGIAMECGFNSKSSFNQIFKDHTGKTPSEFKKSIDL